MKQFYDRYGFCTDMTYIVLYTFDKDMIHQAAHLIKAYLSNVQFTLLLDVQEIT